jgi:hypothetical protein
VGGRWFPTGDLTPQGNCVPALRFRTASQTFVVDPTPPDPSAVLDERVAMVFRNHRDRFPKDKVQKGLSQKDFTRLVLKFGNDVIRNVGNSVFTIPLVLEDTVVDLR